MGTYLDRILARHREVASYDDRDLGDLLDLAQRRGPARGFAAALRDAAATGELGVISEIKRRSPSKGELASEVDPAATARLYEQGGARCLSVLTDTEFFGGSASDLALASAAVSLPVLRKDFTVDARDVADARLMGADAVLLIAAALEPAELRRFHELAVSIGLDVLVEIHDEPELEVALEAGASVVGVNQRDLVTFEVDHERALRMAASIPPDVVRVAESGLRGPEDARDLHQAGYHAVLVGETLMRSGDPAGAVEALRRA